MRLRHALLVFIATIFASQGSAAAATWIAEGRLTSQAAALIQTLNEAERFGLDPRDYSIESLPRSFTTEADQSKAQEILKSAASAFLKGPALGTNRSADSRISFPCSGSAIRYRACSR